MGKRRAGTELNRDNWDDDEPEAIETQSCEPADSTVLATRKILVPKSRRTNMATGLFKSLTGFSNSSALSNFSFNLKPTETSQSAFAPKPPTSPQELAQETEYLKELQTLNRNLLDWVQKHVNSDPHCVLSPVFADYEKHLRQLHEKFPNQAPSNHTENHVQPKSLAQASSYSSSSSPALSGEAASAHPLDAGSQVLTSLPTSSVAKPFSFSLPPLTTNTSVPPLFKFGSSLPISSPFATPSVPANQSVSPEDDDTEVYQPPKPIVREIKEEGSVYSVRCKLFYKAESEWRERGVGNLFIKPQPENKFQLLIRADTNLGNILLNVLVTDKIPIRLQKNNVTLVCVPTPPVPTTKKSSNNSDTSDPVLMLIRLKTEDTAKELLDQMDRHRGIGDTSS